MIIELLEVPIPRLITNYDSESHNMRHYSIVIFSIICTKINIYFIFNLLMKHITQPSQTFLLGM